VPLSTPTSASATIGLWGGRIALPDAGLMIVVPAFALQSPTTITVTAVAGSQVAYEFEPHGTQFLVPIWATQDLSGTSATQGAALYAAYFSNVLDLDLLNGTALVSELFGTTAWGKAVSFPIRHFSGYLIATGRSMDDDVTQ